MPSVPTPLVLQQPVQQAPTRGDSLQDALNVVTTLTDVMATGARIQQGAQALELERMNLAWEQKRMNLLQQENRLEFARRMELLEAEGQNNLQQARVNLEVAKTYSEQGQRDNVTRIRLQQMQNDLIREERDREFDTTEKKLQYHNWRGSQKYSLDAAVSNDDPVQQLSLLSGLIPLMNQADNNEAYGRVEQFGKDKNLLKESLFMGTIHLKIGDEVRAFRYPDVVKHLNDSNPAVRDGMNQALLARNFDPAVIDRIADLQADSGVYGFGSTNQTMTPEQYQQNVRQYIQHMTSMPAGEDPGSWKSLYFTNVNPAMAQTPLAEGWHRERNAAERTALERSNRMYYNTGGAPAGGGDVVDQYLTNPGGLGPGAQAGAGVLQERAVGGPEATTSPTGTQARPAGRSAQEPTAAPAQMVREAPPPQSSEEIDRRIQIEQARIAELQTELERRSTTLQQQADQARARHREIVQQADAAGGGGLASQNRIYRETQYNLRQQLLNIRRELEAEIQAHQRNVTDLNSRRYMMQQRQMQEQYQQQLLAQP